MEAFIKNIVARFVTRYDPGAVEFSIYAPGGYSHDLIYPEGAKVTTDLASLAKPMLVLIVLKLLKTAKIGMDEPIVFDPFKYSPFIDPPITFRSLLSMMAGISCKIKPTGIDRCDTPVERVSEHIGKFHYDTASHDMAVYLALKHEPNTKLQSEFTKILPSYLTKKLTVIETDSYILMPGDKYKFSKYEIFAPLNAYNTFFNLVTHTITEKQPIGIPVEVIKSFFEKSADQYQLSGYGGTLMGHDEDLVFIKLGRKEELTAYTFIWPYKGYGMTIRAECRFHKAGFMLKDIIREIADEIGLYLPKTIPDR